ncbi:MAG: hypothetical protein ACEPO2_22375 [Pelagibaca sp.]
MGSGVPKAIEGAIAILRKAIADGISEEKVAIPKDRLIGCASAYDTRNALSRKAKALQAALPVMEELSRSVRTARDVAEAVRLSRCLLAAG